MASWVFVDQVLLKRAIDAATLLIDPTVASCAKDRVVAFATKTSSTGVLAIFFAVNPSGGLTP